MHKRTGIYFSDANAALLTIKLTSLLAEAGESSFLDYYHRLRDEGTDDPEFQRLINAISVGETWFFREMPQMQTLLVDVLPRLMLSRDTRREPIRIWSAACASGEEPLTLAILIDEVHPEWFSGVQLHATDINAEVVTRARTGVFRERAFRNMPSGTRERYFQSLAEGTRIDPALLARVTFGVGSLLDPSIARHGERYDIILCRNVLIYFDDRSTLAAVKVFSDLLRPDGYLLLGNSESLLRFSLPWTLTEINGAFFYRPDTANAVDRQVAS